MRLSVGFREEVHDDPRELQPTVSKRAIADAFGVSHDTINREFWTKSST